MDIYFSEEETKKAVEEIASNVVFSKVGQVIEVAAPAAPLAAGPDNALARRRAQLLASKQTAPQLAAAGPPGLVSSRYYLLFQSTYLYWLKLI